MAEEKMLVGQQEYDEHKGRCSNSFQEIFDRLGKLDRAMFGEPDLKRKGIVDMMSEMYDSMMMAKGGQKIFWSIVKVAGAIITIIGAFWAAYELISRIKIK